MLKKAAAEEALHDGDVTFSLPVAAAIGGGVVDDSRADSGTGGREGASKLGAIVAPNVRRGAEGSHETVGEKGSSVRRTAVRERVEEDELGEGVHGNEHMTSGGCGGFSLDKEVDGPDAARARR